MALVEDDSRIRSAWQTLLDGTPGFACAAVFDSTEAAWRGWPGEGVDVAVVDWFLPGANGGTCIRELKRRFPRLLCVVITVSHDATVVFEALKAGADGYLLKATPPAGICAALVEVRDGGAPMSPAIARKVLQHFHGSDADRKPNPAVESLSAREIEVLERLRRGDSNKQIGVELGISAETIKAHLKRIYAKLQVSSRVEAVTKYLEG